MKININNPHQIDTPALLILEERLDRNLVKMIDMVGGKADRLMPHVKTNKTLEVVEKMIRNGIDTFKASTVAEAEMALLAGAKEVLVAHQLVGPKIDRFIALQQKFEDRQLSFVVDNEKHIETCNLKAKEYDVTFNLYIDVDNGMHRSGAPLSLIDILKSKIEKSSHCQCMGLHVYDGHLRNPDFEARKREIENALKPICEFNMPMVVGGTPSFSTHALNEEITCSPGTCVYWDWGYSQLLSEQKFEYAAILATRVISVINDTRITVDLGHKAVASENPIDKRIHFINDKNLELIGQSEEHGVIEVKNGNNFKVGDVIYGVPYHVCPTVNLYETVQVINKGNIIDEWNVVARKRKLTC